MRRGAGPSAIAEVLAGRTVMSSARSPIAASGPQPLERTCKTLQSSDELRLWPRGLRRMRLRGAARPNASHKGHEAPGVVGLARSLKRGRRCLPVGGKRSPGSAQASVGPKPNKHWSRVRLWGRKEVPKTTPLKDGTEQGGGQKQDCKMGPVLSPRSSQKCEPNLGERPDNERSRGQCVSCVSTPAVRSPNAPRNEKPRLTTGQLRASLVVQGRVSVGPWPIVEEGGCPLSLGRSRIGRGPAANCELWPWQ